MMRVVSLIPSATEIVCALGAESSLVGRSHECDHPPSVGALPVCTSTKINPTLDSAEIDRQVKESGQRSLYSVDRELLAESRPDVIVTQAHCDVCAVSLSEVERAAPESARVISLSPNRLVDVWADIRKVAEAIGTRQAAEELLADIDTRIREVSARSNSWGKMPTVACVEWIDPPMAAGNWVPEMVELAGGIPLFGKAGEHSPWLNWDDFLAADPEVIVVMPCGFELEKVREEMQALTAKPSWSRLQAVRDGKVWIADGNAYFNRPGPRLIDSFEMLAEAIQPAAYRFGYAGLEQWA